MRIIHKRAKYELPVKLDLGCGNTPKDGYTGMDFADFGQPILWDATEGLPFPDDSVEEVWSSHFVEHIDERGIQIVFLELLRVCKKGTILTIHCPQAENPEAYFLSHFTLWNERRVKGICGGINGCRREKKFRIKYIKQAGMELQFQLEII